MILSVIYLGHAYLRLTNEITLEKAFVEDGDHKVAFLDFLIVHFFEINKKMFVVIDLGITCDVIFRGCFLALLQYLDLNIRVDEFLVWQNQILSSLYMHMDSVIT